MIKQQLGFVLRQYKLDSYKQSLPELNRRLKEIGSSELAPFCKTVILKKHTQAQL